MSDLMVNVEQYAKLEKLEAKIAKLEYSQEKKYSLERVLTINDLLKELIDLKEYLGFEERINPWTGQVY